MRSSTTSLHKWYQQPWLHTYLNLIFFTVFCVTSVSCSPTRPSYTHHCSAIVPELAPTSLESSTSTLPRHQNGYFYGGDRILNPNSPYNLPNFFKYLKFRLLKVYKTGVEGVFKVEALLILDSLGFTLQGFYSESSGKLCMVGYGSDAAEGNFLGQLGAVLKLNYVKNSSIFTNLFTGTLESSNSGNYSNNFEPISILLLTQMNYKYTLVLKEFDGEFSGGSHIRKSLPLSSQRPKSLCSILSRPRYGLELKYASHCDSTKNCTPFGGSDIGYLPHFMYLNAIQCSEDGLRSRFLLEFLDTSEVEYDWSLNPNTTLVGEGLWDAKKNQLYVVACRILNMTDSVVNAYVGDCSIRLSLRFPAVWSIRDSSSIVGQIWSNKKANDSGYFDRIMYRSSDNPMEGVPADFKYEYTEIDRVRESCPAKWPVKNKEVSYPNVYSYEMRVDMSVENSEGRIARGYSIPLCVGNLYYGQQYYLYPMPLSSSRPLTSSVVEANTIHSSLTNISYIIGFTMLPGVNLSDGISLFDTSSSLNRRAEISAEGIYDAETGGLCMVGCRNIGSSNGTSTSDSMDCEILVNFQFPPSNSKKNGGKIKGSIKSTREKSDPLHFERLDLSANVVTIIDGRTYSYFLRRDLETILVLISNTLSCVFVGLQLFYVKKHPDMLPFTSLVMLVILSLGYTTPLMTNIEVLFLRQIKINLGNLFLLSAERLEEVITMIAFLLQFHLLRLTWSAKLSDGSKKNLWVAEKKVLSVYLPFYVAGGLITSFVNWRKNNNGFVMLSSRPIGNYQWHSLWGDLKSYGGLVVDGFLLPQILLNVFCNLREKPLSCSFYIGTTFMRLLPHMYDLYRAHNYVGLSKWSYIYANPGAGFYSTTWNVIIPCGGLLFATIIYLQQCFGGCCILPRRFQPSEVYEKIPVVSNE